MSRDRRSRRGKFGQDDQPSKTTPTPEQAKSQIDVLLEEYRALREDINGRIASQMTLLGVFGAGFAFVVALQRVAWWTYVVVGFVFFVVIFAVWATNTFWNQKIADRLRHVERKINRLSKDALGLAEGDELLGFQSSIHSRQTGALTRFMTTIKLVPEIDSVGVSDGMHLSPSSTKSPNQ